MGEISAALRVELLAIGVTPALLIAALAWWFRERLKQSLAKALNTHTEQVKLSAQRDIEAYKVSLIASIERQKAQSELKKAIAIKHATHEYEALVALHARLGEVPSSVISTAAIVSAAKLGEPERLEYYRRIDSQLNSFGDAIDLAHLRCVSS